MAVISMNRSWPPLPLTYAEAVTQVGFKARVAIWLRHVQEDGNVQASSINDGSTVLIPAVHARSAADRGPPEAATLQLALKAQIISTPSDSDGDTYKFGVLTYRRCIIASVTLQMTAMTPQHPGLSAMERGSV